MTAEGGREINTYGGVLHFTGIGWAGGAGQSAEVFGAEWTGYGPRVEPGFVSGACLVISRDLYAELGGMPERFFLYHEDVDLSLRVRLAGGTLGVETAARVDHDYEFDKGAAKWRYLERNRWATLIRTYPGALLLLLAAGAARDRGCAGVRRGVRRLAAAEGARLGRDADVAAAPGRRAAPDPRRSRDRRG